MGTHSRPAGVHIKSLSLHSRQLQGRRPSFTACPPSVGTLYDRWKLGALTRSEFLEYVEALGVDDILTKALGEPSRSTLSSRCTIRSSDAAFLQCRLLVG